MLDRLGTRKYAQENNCQDELKNAPAQLSDEPSVALGLRW